MHNLRREINSIPINYVLIVFFWSIATLLFSIPFNAEITTIILFFTILKINFAKTFKIKSSNAFIPLYGCIFGLLIYYISKIASYDHYSPFDKASFIKYFFVQIDERFFMLNFDMVSLLFSTFILLPFIGGIFLACDAYIKSDIKQFKGPLIDCLTNLSPKKINVESPLDVLDSLCEYAAISMFSILITGFFVGFVLYFPIVLACTSLFYLLPAKNTSYHKEVKKISIKPDIQTPTYKPYINRLVKLWVNRTSLNKIIASYNKPEEELKKTILLISNFKINIIKIYSWMAFIPLITIILLGIYNDGYILFISVPTICYFLLYNFNLNKRLQYNEKTPLPFGSIYFIIACMLSLNILIFREILIIDIMLNLSLNSFQNFLIKNGLSIMILNSILATILLLMEYSNKFKKFDEGDILKDEYKIIIFAILGVLVVPFVAAFHSPAPSNFLFLVLVMFFALMILASYALSYNHIETKQFIKKNINITKIVLISICISGSIIIIYLYSYFSSISVPENKLPLILLLFCVPALIALSINILFAKK
ncbi:MAG: hypothetical protein KAJ19_24705 [Gammaproteobacteria bacterium]|nr:hypothetical protein [Gammaproteobacteria bacterium]